MNERSLERLKIDREMDIGPNGENGWSLESKKDPKEIGDNQARAGRHRGTVVRRKPH